ncbi:MAG: hypothetical protein U0736_11735 [Gemmataceae bacterium]
MTLSSLGATTGSTDQASIIGGFTDINVLVGSNTDTLTGQITEVHRIRGATASNTFTSDKGNAAERSLAFSEIENLTGDGDADTFLISRPLRQPDRQRRGRHGDGQRALTGNVSLGDDNDVVNLRNAASITGSVAGGAGIDKLDYTGFTDTITVSVTASTVDGLTASATGITGGITGLNELKGRAVVGDTLVNDTGEAGTFTVDGSNTFDFTENVGGELAFSEIENLTGDGDVDIFNVSVAHTGKLTGNGAADQFNLSGDAVLTGSIDAGAGADTITLAGTSSVSGTIDGGSESDKLSFDGSTDGRTITLTGLGTDGYSGNTTGVGGFTNVNELVGSDQDDTLIGRNVVATWAVGGSEKYTSGDRELPFSAIENLTGGSAVDTFNVSDDHAGNLSGMGDNDAFNLSGGTLSGGISGGDGVDTFTVTADATVNDGLTGDAGADTFDLRALLTGKISGGADADTLTYASYGSAASVILTGSSAAGYQGMGSLLTNGFDTIDTVTANTTAHGSLKGEHVVSTWTLATDATYNDGTATLHFSNFNSLVGGAAADTFKVKDNTVFAGSIDGGVGSNVLTYADESNDVGITVNITATNAGNVGGSLSFSNVSALVGTKSTDAFNYR